MECARDVLHVFTTVASITTYSIHCRCPVTGLLQSMCTIYVQSATDTALAVKSACTLCNNTLTYSVICTCTLNWCVHWYCSLNVHCVTMRALTANSARPQCTYECTYSIRLTSAVYQCVHWKCRLHLLRTSGTTGVKLQCVVNRSYKSRCGVCCWPVHHVYQQCIDMPENSCWLQFFAHQWLYCTLLFQEICTAKMFATEMRHLIYLPWVYRSTDTETEGYCYSCSTL